MANSNSQSNNYQSNLQSYQKQQNQSTAVKSSVEISSKPSQPVSIAERSNAQYDSRVNAYQQAKSASSTVISPAAKTVPVKSTTTVSSTASTPVLATRESTSNNSNNNSDQSNVVASNPGPNQVIIGSGNNNQANNQDKQVYYNNVSDAPSQPYHQADNLVDAGFTTDKAVYNPGDTVHASLTIKNMNNYNQWGVYKLNVFNPLTQETTVASGNWKVDQGQSQTLNVDWTTPKIDENYTMSIFTKPSPYDKQTFTDVTDNHPSTPEVIYGPVPKNAPSSSTSSSSDTTNSQPANNGSNSSSSETKSSASNSEPSSNTSSTKQSTTSSSSTTESKPTSNEPDNGSTNAKPATKPAINSSSNSKPISSSPASNPSTGNTDENKPVQKPDGTVAKNPDDITPGSTEPERPATDDDHSSVSNSNVNNEKPTSKVNVTSNNQSSSNTSDLNTANTSSENDTVPAKTQSSVQPNSTADNAQKQTQSLAEIAYKPVNRPMTQTEQMVMNANAGNKVQASLQNNAKKVTTQVSSRGRLVSAKTVETNSNSTLPQTGENANEDAMIGISLLGIVGTVGLALEKKRYNI